MTYKRMRPKFEATNLSFIEAVAFGVFITIEIFSPHSHLITD